MRSYTTIAAVAALASTVAASRYEDDIFAREAEADAEPIHGLNHMGKWTENSLGSVAGGFRQKSGGGFEEKSGGGFEEKSGGGFKEKSGGGLKEKSGGGFKEKSGGGGGGGREGRGGGGGGGEKSQRRSLDGEEYLEALYAREAEADAEPIFGLNHLGKWTGNALGSIAGGFRKKSGGGGGGGGGGGEQNQRRSLDNDEYLEALYARYADADAEPIFGLNHLGKWTGNAFGSIAGGFRQKSGGGEQQQYGDPSAQMYRREAEAEDDFDFE